ncbi:hypothetical protein [Microbacterium aureliae]
MSSTRVPEASLGAAHPRPRTIRRRSLQVLLGLGAVGAVIAGSVLFGWTVDETRFDRPSAELDAFAADLAALPDVDSVETERWVEAPTFSTPMTSIAVTVGREGLGGVLRAACDGAYDDPVGWSIRVPLPSSTEAVLAADPDPADPADPADGIPACPHFGFDAEGFVEQLGRLAPGLRVQPAVWGDGVFALVETTYDEQLALDRLLPLVEDAEVLRGAAGLDAGHVVEVNAPNLGLTLAPGDAGGYATLLARLADLGARAFWVAQDDTAGGDGAVQLDAPGDRHPALEQAVRSSGLAIADAPVSFLDSAP